jgi:hypothetical protein
MQDVNTRPDKCGHQPSAKVKGKSSHVTVVDHRRGGLSPWAGRNGFEDDADMLDGASSDSAAERSASKCEPEWLIAPPIVLASGLGSMGSMAGGSAGVGVSLMKDS